MNSKLRASFALSSIAVASWLSGCAGLQDPTQRLGADVPPPPRLTTVSTGATRAQEGPLAPMAGIDPAAAVTPPSSLRETAPDPALADLFQTPPNVEVRALSRGDIASTALPPGQLENESGKGAAGQPTDTLNPDQPPQDTTQAHRDLWQRVRIGYRMPELGGDLVAAHERWYSSRPDYVKRMTERGGRYLFHIVEEVERRGMPSELALLPFIESAFNPQAMSVAKASGMWQFIPSTGRDFALKQNIFRDDRRDVLASTRAALDYLTRLNNMFNDWHLALAAYNWGEGNVQRAINRNRRLGLPTDYESLNMPAETRNYVPKLQAVKNIVTSPQTYGLTLPDLKNHPYFMSVAIKRDIDVALAAQLAGLGIEEFKTLNPSMNKPVILAAATPQLLLPYDNAGDFVRRLEAHRGPLATWTAWVVPRTMRPADAAKQVGLNETALRDINRIPPRMLVKAGSTLLVPRSVQRSVDVSEKVADNAHMLLAPDVPPLRKVAIKARKGDTVASLAKRYRVSAAQFAQWNRVTARTRFSAGESLVIYQAAKPAGKAVGKSVRRAQAPSKAPAKAIRLASNRN